MTEKKKKLVSIVVPVYNVEPYLRTCLDSLIGQTYEKIEIILVDDGSTDQSGDICDEYARRDTRIRVCHKKNRGVSAARNTGIEMAEGEYLVFVDSDDCVHRQMVELYMSCEKDNEILICDQTLDITDLSHIFDRIESECVKREEFMRLFFHDYVNSPVDKFYRFNIIEENEIRFPESKNLGEDLFFNLDYFRQMSGNFFIIHCPLYYYRSDQAGSLSNSYRQDLFELQIEMFRALRTFLEDMNIWTEKNAEIYYQMYWDRLYMTARMCKVYEKEHPEERRLPELLAHPVWQEVWKECERRGLVTWKRRIKAASLNLWKLLK